jgi:hypothetical protein
MSETQTAETAPTEAGRDEILSALFGQLVLQQANMAMMLLGKVAHPESGEVVKDLDAARLFIDQLEMLEAKTKGNLNKQEASLLKQSLMSLRMAFVEAVDSPQTQAGTKPAEPAAAPSAGPTTEPSQAPSTDEDHRKKFSKKY